MASYDEIFENNRKWVEQNTERDPDFFSRLATHQEPEFLFIGCADSRVPANEIMGLSPGDVFVHRNIANLVVNTDINAQSVIEYAVGHLEVKHIIVCGHYGCGGVAAAMQPADLGLLNGWLREIRDVYRLYQEELDAIEDTDARYRRLIELNIREQCVNVIKTAVVQKKFLRTGHPIVHGWVYDISNGLLRDLEIPFGEILAAIQEIYRLEET
ncbi:MAG: carbonic anhydrase [Deltaproteobacteria bacterium]|nr:carbonic anhydrase [Deltaproteobacteria bacterium]MBW1904393.1 carbonic anhydrase [Deltaproteobacteria bacterium]MBW2158552.1 carbonic anhydrase [Deltaproteobacteria bacterium]MBW2374633.1 carbonic anhydrase [Deltaproteobacteria bacterium]MBW2585665.1 carbonic anhydrase [Deltaproteobacteria bacterium]